ncbi:MAG: hypothetical protein ACLFPW_01860 [Spirochaetaceae bacterium]
MKRNILLLLMVSVLALLFAGCGSDPEPAPEPSPTENVQEPILKRPDMLDHKNYKWGREVPDWVVMSSQELEEMDRFDDQYVFKFESPRAQDLQGAELWTRNFQAASQIAQVVRNRVQTKFAGAAAGDMDMLETYMEQVVQSFSDAQFSGYQPVEDYWVQMRYYNDDGSVDEDAYTYLVLYTIPEQTLDRMINEALDQAENENQPETEEEETARERVKEAFENGLD